MGFEYYVLMDEMQEHMLGFVSYPFIPTTLLKDNIMLLSSSTLFSMPRKPP